MRLEQIIAEADQIIEKKASKKQEVPVASSTDDDTVKIASFLESFEEKPGSKEESPFQMTFVEKLASAVAMVEALNNIEDFQKLASFKEAAISKGFTPEQVDSFLEKKAIKLPSSVPMSAFSVAADAGI